MGRLRAWILGAIALLAFCFGANAQQPSSGAKRVALVIGNAEYKGGKLANPVNDARAMAARLRELGFEVVMRENLKTREVGGVYREFRSKIVPGSVALVFYAGHGVQIRGQNYFPTVDAAIASEEDVPLQSLNLASLLDNMDEAKAAISLVFLDACRDNPYARRMRNGAKGLAKAETASGTLIHYATRPGSVADDGPGRNGTYTEELLSAINQPGVPVEIMLKQVTNRVVAKTQGKQEPWVEGSLRGDFYFVGGKPPEPVQAAAAAPAPAPAAASTRATPGSAAPGASRFDGVWRLTMTCPAYQDALGYTRAYPVDVANGKLRGHEGREGEPGYFLIEGRIGADGVAQLEGSGVTANPKVTVGQVRTGSRYSFPVTVQFSETRGSGQRTRTRPCDLLFARN